MNGTLTETLTETHPEVYDGLRQRHTRKQIVETGHWTNMCRVCGETFPCATAQLLGERDGLQAEVAALREDHVALANVSGALCDAGGIVPAEAWRYGEAVRAIVAERDEARAALALVDGARAMTAEERDAYREVKRRLFKPVDGARREGGTDVDT